MPIGSARRDLSNGGVYGVAWVPWHGAQQIFARPSPPAGRSAVRFRPWDCQAPPDRQEMQRHRARAHCDHRRPCWQRSGRSCMASPEPLPLGPAAAANAPLPGMPQRAWPRALRCHHRSAQLHHRRAFRALGHSLCCRRRRRKSSVGSFNPPASKRMCGTGASASARLAPWKGQRRCPFPRRRPPRHLRPSWPRAHATQSTCALLASSRFALSAQSEPLRSRLDPLDRE